MDTVDDGWSEDITAEAKNHRHGDGPTRSPPRHPHRTSVPKDTIRLLVAPEAAAAQDPAGFRAGPLNLPGFRMEKSALLGAPEPTPAVLMIHSGRETSNL